eukprot:TRINITY_DN10427_c5_g1_i1.p1 TRINITY_DN10427_c5_g1~~TRINITY_DN10427_c5_g1_i1.p1  ORF type:complete len:103 (+),score=9.61 TRINITY_DN10427_c5_g1_i1:189-497(+)
MDFKKLICTTNPACWILPSIEMREIKLNKPGLIHTKLSSSVFVLVVRAFSMFQGLASRQAIKLGIHRGEHLHHFFEHPILACSQGAYLRLKSLNLWFLHAYL